MIILEEKDDMKMGREEFVVVNKIQGMKLW